MSALITERIDRITRIGEEYRAACLPAPKAVKIELTARCNFNCVFCARSFRLREQQDMDRELFERLLLEMRSEGVEEVGLFYLGESFLCKWLPEAVFFAKHTAKFPYVFLTTNGSLAKPEIVGRCIKNGLDSLKFSLNWADVEQFREIARVKNSLFADVTENIIGCKEVRDRIEAETGHWCGLYGSYIEYTGGQKDKMSTYLGTLRPFLDEIYALPLYSQASLVEEGERELGWEPTAGNRGRVGALRDPLPCWAAFTEGHITWDGKLSACCFDHDGRFHMGDLTKEGFLEAWNSSTFQALRRAHLERDVSETPCATCVAYS
jgi:radical SAM protein with 4Fe4S-binding SPASM domain